MTTPAPGRSPLTTPVRVGSAQAPSPARPVRLVALDLDGTTLDLDQRLHPRTRAAVRSAIERGVHVVAATGRMYRSALPWAGELGLRTPLICYQGAVVRDLPAPGAVELDGVPQGRLIAEDALDGDSASCAIAVARSGGWHVQAYRDDHLLCERGGPEADFYGRIAQVGYELVPDLGSLVEEGSTKIVCVVLDSAGAARCEAALGAALGDRARVVRSLPQFVEVTNPVASKARALRRVAGLYGVGLDEAVAVGDAPNDVDMMEAAGFAVAVETAPDAVLAAADAVCAPPGEAGVADLLEALGLTG